MAVRTGIPKRSLEKYMLRRGANFPRQDSLIALSRGLGVSIDYLVRGSEAVSRGTELLVEKAATEEAVKFFSTLVEHHSTGKSVFQDEEIMGLSPEEWGADLGVRVAERAKQMAAEGATMEELLEWQAGRKELTWEKARDRIDRRTRKADCT